MQQIQIRWLHLPNGLFSRFYTIQPNLEIVTFCTWPEIYTIDSLTSDFLKHTRTFYVHHIKSCRHHVISYVRLSQPFSRPQGYVCVENGAQLVPPEMAILYSMRERGPVGFVYWTCRMPVQHNEIALIKSSKGVFISLFIVINEYIIHESEFSFSAVYFLSQKCWQKWEQA